MQNADDNFNETKLIFDQLKEFLKTKKKGVVLKTINLKLGPHMLEINKWKFYNSFYSSKTHVTLARSIFTYKVLDDGSNNSEHVVFSRGYDKFTDYEKIKKEKRDLLDKSAYFELTVKENGCLLMASGIKYKNFSKLIISSKNVLSIENESKHANYGEAIVDSCLKTANKSKQDLIDYIINENVTLLFELCDDTFEEHVLAYKERSGLYIHGIIKNDLTRFISYGAAEVNKVALMFGFKEMEYESFQNTNIKEIVKKVESTKGVYNNRLIEGFVCRTKLNAEDESKDAVDFMVKFKFEYPYLMYREWREITKLFIQNQKTDKIKFKETLDYLKWLEMEYATNKNTFDGYLENKGIVNARQKYLIFKNK